MSVAAVVLAAGASRRLGRPKQNVKINGESLLQRAVRVAAEAGLQPIIVVTRPDATGHLFAEDAEVVVNPAPDEGIASSIRCGVRATHDHHVDGAVLMTCDQPGVSSGHLRMLSKIRTELTGSYYAGRVGTPAYFPATFFEKLLGLSGDSGARELLRGARALVAEELELDIDSEEDVAAAVRLFESKGRDR